MTRSRFSFVSNRLAIAFAFCAAMASAAHAQHEAAKEKAAGPRVAEKAPVAPEAPEAPDAKQVAAWIADLESHSQATRSAAQTALQRAGDAALAQIVAAVRSPSPEVRLRCVEILRRHAAGDDPTRAQAGQSALDTLAQDADMGVARAAESAIAANARQRAADEYAEQQEQLMLGRGRALVRLRPLAVAKAVGIPAGAVRSVSISVVNGKRNIVAQSGDERVEISDGDDAGIKLSITKKVDGKETKETYAAKDAAELKAKHPAAHKVYEQYAKDGGVKIEAKLLLEAIDQVDKPALPKGGAGGGPER